MIMETTTDEELIAGIKARAALAKAAGPPESAGRCKVADENLTARHKIPPIADTVGIGDDGQSKTGVCSLCGTRAKVSDKGVMTAHVMRGETLPASPALSEPNVIPTDMGSRVGDPEAGSKRRAEEIDGTFERGTVDVKMKQESGPDKGKLKITAVPATAENLQLALTQELARRVRAEASVKAKAENVASLRRRLDAARQGLSKVNAERSHSPKIGTAHRTSGQRGEGRLDGVALVQGANMAPVQPQKGWAAASGTMWGPIGQDRADKTIVKGEMVGGAHGYKTQDQYRALSRRQQRTYWQNVKKNRERAERAREYSRVRPVGVRQVGTDRSETFETEQLMRRPR